MRRTLLMRWTAIGLCVSLGTVTQVAAQTTAGAKPAVGVSAGTGKKPITHDVYALWRSIQGSVLSRDGAWLVYALVPQEGDGEIVARNLKAGTEYRHPRGRGAAITADGKFAVFTVVPPKAETDKAKKDKKKPEEMPKNGLGILDLATGKVTIIARVKSFSVPEDGGHFVAYLREATPAASNSAGAGQSTSAGAKPEEQPKEASATPAPPKTNPATGIPPTGTVPASPTPPVTPLPAPPAAPPTPAATTTAPGAAKTEPGKTESGEKKETPPPAKKKDPGTDLVVRDLATGAETTLAEVVSYVWNKPGTWLAYSVSSKTPLKDGAYVRRGEDGVTRALLTGVGNYKNLTFDEKGAQLAFVSDRDDYKAETPTFKLYHWTVTAQKAAQIAATPATGAAKGMVVSDSAGLDFSRNGARLFFSLTPPPPAKPKDAPDVVNVDIWSWKDPELQTMQKVGAEAERRRSYRAVWQVKEKRLVPLGSPDLPNITTGEDNAFAVGTSNLPYRPLVSWDTGYSDVYLVSMENGTREKVLEKSRTGASLSPGGKYLLFWSDADRAWYARRTSDGKRTNLTGRLAVSFQNETHDTPDAPRPYSSAGWTDNDASVLIYDRYDIWEINPENPASARRITNGRGRADQMIFRYQRLDSEERFIPRNRPLLLDTVNDRTKASGFHRTAAPLSAPGSAASPVLLVMQDKAFGNPIKAKNADTVVVSASRFEEFPNLWLTSTNFSNLRRVTDANPQQAQYRWGKSELIEYINADGKRLRAILTRPDDFDPSKKYPLMVYIYEKMTDTLHGYTPPGPGTSINATRYVSNGYILLEPDIVYTTGYPGESALKCVVPAVQKVLSYGYVDPQRIGIQGHSWGGYQITYLVTRTNIFRAVQAGASVTNMISAYGGIRYGSGMSRAFQYEQAQSRMGAPPWASPLQYLENSPIFWADKVTTPYLTIHNDADGAVPWTQAIEFFTALRRLGKEAYLFNYNGEDHGLANRENQKHWTVHMAEFFDHYLLGAPRPAWMDQGVPYRDRGTRDLRPLFKSATEGEKAGSAAVSSVAGSRP